MTPRKGLLTSSTNSDGAARRSKVHVTREDVQRRITTFWDTVAPGYNSPENVATPGSADYDAWLVALARLLPSGPARVLDVGTGTGFAAGLAARLGHRVTAIDLSLAMLEIARAGDARHTVRFVLGDAVTPDFAPASFDAIISRSVLWTLREPDRALGSWYELLAPGGRVIAIYGLSPPDESAATSSGSEPSLFERHYNADTRSALPAMRLSTHEPLQRAAASAGFQRVRIEPLQSLEGWETSPGSSLPYALLAERPPERQDVA